MDEPNLEDCVKKCSLKKSKNGDNAWLITDGGCKQCSYVGLVKIYYCRKPEVYEKYGVEQLKLPFENERANTI